MGAENRVTVSDQRVQRQADLTVTVKRTPSMIARCGLRTRLPDACSRAELAGAARTLRRGKGRRDPGAAGGVAPTSTGSSVMPGPRAQSRNGSWVSMACSGACGRSERTTRADRAPSTGLEIHRHRPQRRRNASTRRHRHPPQPDMVRRAQHDHPVHLATTRGEPGVRGARNGPRVPVARVRGDHRRRSPAACRRGRQQGVHRRGQRHRVGRVELPGHRRRAHPHRPLPPAPAIDTGSRRLPHRPTGPS